MIRLLALDTSTPRAGAALLEDDGAASVVVASAGFEGRDVMAARILPLVEEVLAAAGWPKSSLDAFAAARGPGTFTGLRVGLGLVRGLAIAADRPCVGVGTLEAMAEARGPGDRDRVPLLDAGRREVYAARYDAASRPPREIDPPWVGPLARILDTDVGSPAVVFGPGAPESETELPAGWAVERAVLAVAEGVGRLAAARLRAGAIVDDLAPLYVRPAGAEAKRR